MNTFFTPVLAAVMLLSATGGTTLAAEPTQAGADPGPVYVDSTDIRYLESYPVQVQLVVSGTLPTPCHEPVFEVQDFGTSIDVSLWSLTDPELVCAQVLEPFELAIPLGSFEAADIPVTLNGEEIGRIEIGGVAVEPAVTGAGWSFGFCLGYCRADLVIDGDTLSLSGYDREAETPLYTNSGRLTIEGAAQLADAASQLAGVSLEPAYGCPDCADGGAAYLEIKRDGLPERIAMEFGNPPEPLAELYQITAAMIEALEACQSNELVDIAPDCAPYERR